MASYRIEWKRSAEKDVRKIDPLRIPAIVQVAEPLADEPFPSWFSTQLEGCLDERRHQTNGQQSERIVEFPAQRAEIFCESFVPIHKKENSPRVLGAFAVPSFINIRETCPPKL
jgi:hypothetical protein